MSNMFIAKLGSRYENIYYYKQKVVNWDFTAPSSYECLLSCPISKGLYSCITTISLKTIYNYIDINILTYITEESYRDTSVYYDITVTNITTPTIPVLLIDYATTNKDTEIVYKKLNTSLIVGNIAYSDIKVKIKFNKTLTFPFSDVVSANVFTQFPRGTYNTKKELEETSINFIADINIVPENEQIHNNTQFSSFLSKDIVLNPVRIENFENIGLHDVNTVFCNHMSICGILLSVRSALTLSQEESIDLDTMYTNVDMSNISSLSLSYVSSTYIVH